jgi:hypothetical protein
VFKTFGTALVRLRDAGQSTNIFAIGRDSSQDFVYTLINNALPMLGNALAFGGLNY